MTITDLFPTLCRLVDKETGEFQTYALHCETRVSDCRYVPNGATLLGLVEGEFVVELHLVKDENMFYIPYDTATMHIVDLTEYHLEEHPEGVIEIVLKVGPDPKKKKKIRQPESVDVARPFV